MTRPLRNSPEDLVRQMRIVKIIAALWAVVLGGMGVWSMLIEFHTGRTRYGVVVAQTGNAAVWMGLMQVALGVIMLAVFFSSKRERMIWAVGCMLTVLAAMTLAMSTV